MTNRQVYSWREEMRKSVLLLPTAAVLLCFFIVPIVLTMYYSSTDMTLSGSDAGNLRFIDLESYQRILTNPSTITAIKNTLVSLAGSPARQTTLGFTVAYFMRQKIKVFRSVVSPCFLVDWMMPEIVVTLCFVAFLEGDGALNVLLGAVGIKGITWLYEYPIPSVIIANVRYGTAFSMLNFQSVLDNVPGEIKETARVGGANRLQVLIHVIVPCVKDSTAVNVMPNTLSILGVYGLVCAMTGGGPANKTIALSICMYSRGFKGMQLELRTIIGMLILLMGIIRNLIYAGILRSKGQGGVQHE